MRLQGAERGDVRHPAAARNSGDVLACADGHPAPRQRHVQKRLGGGRRRARGQQRRRQRGEAARLPAGAAGEGHLLAEYQGGPRLDRQAQHHRLRPERAQRPLQGPLLAALPLHRRGHQLVPHLRRRITLLHRRRRHFRLRVLSEELARAALHQLRQREAAAHVHGSRLRERDCRVQEGGHRRDRHQVRGQHAGGGPHREQGERRAAAALGGVLLPQRLGRLVPLQAEAGAPQERQVLRGAHGAARLHHRALPGQGYVRLARLPREEQGPALAGPDGADAVLRRPICR
mmetsp:Transcript_4176/g.9040  ORF Transcript_4176/g.9040 Transcript_4176/m.9040 type:complete len:288 (+) Transcript_4176:844-1707(+)